MIARTIQTDAEGERVDRPWLRNGDIKYASFRNIVTINIERFAIVQQ